jgi:uncharacterized protein involved in exopolysaccharide biosynthesis
VKPRDEKWDDVDTLSLGDILRRLWVGRIWIVSATTVCLAVALGLALLSTRIYRATVLLVPATEARGMNGPLSSGLGQLGGLASLAGINLGASDAATEEALAVLRSRTFSERFISQMNLLPELFPSRWDAERKQWLAKEDVPTLSAGFRKFDRRVRSVVQDKKTGLVSVRIDWVDAKKAAEWANALVALLNDEMRRRAKVESEASLQFLNNELQSTVAVDTRSAINRLIEAQINKRMLANVLYDYAFRIVDPALPADRDDPVWPIRWLLILGGVLLGLLLGSGLALVLYRTDR